MIDPDDDRTKNLLIDGVAQSEFADAERVIQRIKSAEQLEREEKEVFLRDSHALVRVKTPVFIEDPKLAKELRAKALAAARSADYREKKKAESGLVLSMTPIDVVEQVKKVGGWAKWVETQKAVALEHEKTLVKKHESALESAQKLAFEAQVLHEKALADTALQLKQANEKNAELRSRLTALQLSKQQKDAIRAGEKVQKLTGFRRFLMQKIIGF
jgi:hypothetical protein